MRLEVSIVNQINTATTSIVFTAILTWNFRWWIILELKLVLIIHVDRDSAMNRVQQDKLSNILKASCHSSKWVSRFSCFSYSPSFGYSSELCSKFSSHLQNFPSQSRNIIFWILVKTCLPCQSWLILSVIEVRINLFFFCLLVICYGITFYFFAN